MNDKKNPAAEAQFKSAIAEIKAENAQDPWSLADKEGNALDTPMDGKTIKNAIIKRLPEAKRIQLVRIGDLGAMRIVVVCQLLHETAILIEDAANIFMRHTDLMNIVDDMHRELSKRKRRMKNNKLPRNFFRSNDDIGLSQYSK